MSKPARVWLREQLDVIGLPKIPRQFVGCWSQTEDGATALCLPGERPVEFREVVKKGG